MLQLDYTKGNFAFQEYFSESSDFLISYTQISSIILIEGEADDHENLRINGGIENIPLEDEELPVLGTVTFT